LGRFTPGNIFFGWLLKSRDDERSAAVTFFGNRIVISGANGLVVTPMTEFIHDLLAQPDQLAGEFGASPNRVVAVGDNANIYTSPDGAAWTRVSSTTNPPSVGGNWLLSVAYGNGVFVTRRGRLQRELH